MTVNKALSQLAKAGLIERRRRSGSFVRMPKSQAAVLEITDIRAEVQALNLPYRYELVSAPSARLAPPIARASALLPAPGCSPFRADILRAQTLLRRGSSHQPRHRAGGCRESFAESPPGPWLIGRVPWSGAEHRNPCGESDAAAPSAGTSSRHRLPRVERQTWSADSR